MNFDTAASDLVAAMALIAVFVTAAAIVSVTLFSSPIGDTAPAMIARNETAEGGNLLYIYHEGGDPLEREHFEILIDGVPQVRNFTLSDASGEEQTDWTSWKTGEALVLDKNKLTSKNLDNLHIQIVGEGMGRAGSDWLLHEIGEGTPVPVPVPPVAGFTANTTAGPAPLAVQFNDTSTGNPGEWQWDFGDGNTSTDQNPSHTYESAGNYTVTLNASNAYGYSISAPTTITVLEPLAANFTANVTEGNAPLTVQFTDESAGDVTTWAWDFGDGNTSAVQDPIHTYESPGNYTVILNASNAYGYSISAPTTITVLELPAANFTANPTEDNAPLAVQFTDQSTGNVTTWLWNFGDGNTSTVQHPIYTYESPGNYTVTLNASNDYGFSIETKSDYITVLEPPAANFSANVTEGNAPLTVQFTDESTGNVTTWLWNFGDGNTSTVQNPSHTYVTAGNYTVTLNASNDYGFSIETKSDYITVLEPPAAAFTADPTEGNAPLAVQFTDESAGNVTAWAWNFGDGNTSGEQNPSHTYTTPGNYTATLNASNAYGYSISAPIMITVLEPPAADFTADPTEGNAPLEIQFTGESAGDVTTWAWDFGDGSTSIVQHPIHTYESPGTYTVTLNASNTYGFSIKTKTEYITVLESSAANFTANVTEGNAPLAVQFNDTSTGNPSEWHWDFGDGNTSTVQHPIHTYESPGNYTITLTAKNAYGNNTHTRPNYIQVTEKSFIDTVIDENVFVYGTILSITGSASVMGEGATVVITEGLNLGGSSVVAVSNIYVNGSVTSIGSSSFGPPDPPGKICINGDLTLAGGARDVYGDIYVNGNFDFTGGTINRNVYVGGDLTLGWGARFADGAHIYYTGTNKTPSGINCDNCTPNAVYPGFTTPDLEIPPAKPDSWYMERGYVSSELPLTSNMKIFDDSYSSTSWRPTATDVIIIARDGDITITNIGDSNVTGVFFAPKGRVTFGGKSLEGVVIARDGLFVERGDTVVTFKNINEYILNPEDYPF